MPGPNSAVTVADGSVDWSGGVDSLKVTTVQSAQNPNGLARNQLAWLNNATVRDGGITQRPAWTLMGRVHDATGLYQGGYLYQPVDGGTPYFILSISGRIFQVYPDFFAAPVDLSERWQVSNPPAAPRANFCQGEQFLVIQAGDLVTLPLFWDGLGLRRSRGLLGSRSVSSANPLVYSVTLQNQDTTAGTNFPAQTGSDNPLQVPYSSFVAPAIAATVAVTLQSAFPGAVNDIITFPVAATNTGHLQWVSSIFVGGKWTTTLKNLDIPAGSAVTGGSYPNSLGTLVIPNFTAPAINSNITVDGESFFNTPITVTYASSGDHHFKVTAINNAAADVQSSVSELPAATCMDYYMGRIWYAQRRTYTAGDIVKGVYGTLAYGFTDSVLKVTENPLALGGDGFTVPSENGDITALAHNANLNTALGQGTLFAMTAKAIYSLQVPVSRTNWIAANDATQPLQSVVQLNNGAISDRAVTPVNGDLYYQSIEPHVRSLITALRFFTQPGNLPISAVEERVLQFSDRSLTNYATGIYFDNRLIQSIMPKQTPQGVVHQAVMPLDFTPISSFGTEQTPIWEGNWEGLQILQMFTGLFNGRERAFALAVAGDGGIDLWEMTESGRFDAKGDTRVTWYAEYPAFTWGNEFAMKKLVSAELWVDKVFGEVVFTLDYRPDSDGCWRRWHEWKVCSARNSCEDLNNPICYPLRPFGEGYKTTMTLPLPPNICESFTGRPSDEGCQFQARLTVKGFCRIRGFLLHATMRERKLYEAKVC